MFRYPEVDIGVFAFLLYFVWEFWQVSWYQGVPEMSHLDGVVLCTRATFGDVAISLCAYLAVAWAVHDRYWAKRPTTARVGGFVTIGLAITIVLEWLATEVLDRWQYAETMPTIPLVGTGLAPVLQWIVVPALLMMLIKRVWAAERT